MYEAIYEKQIKDSNMFYNPTLQRFGTHVADLDNDQTELKIVVFKLSLMAS